MKKILMFWFVLVTALCSAQQGGLPSTLAPTFYNAGTGGVSANTLVMGDGAGNVIPYTASSATTGLFVGVATATATAGNPVTVANTAGQLIPCQFDGTPVVGDAVIGSATAGDCHDNGNTPAFDVQPFATIVGWVQSVSGIVGTVRLAGLGVWGAGNLVVDNKTGTQSFYGPLAMPQIIASKVGTVFYADGFTESILFPGVGVPQAAFNSAKNYQQCTAVSYSGGNYLSVAYLSNLITPGTNSAYWYPVPNGNTPTYADCAYYTAASTIVSGATTIVNSGVGTSLILGNGTYDTCIGWKQPTVTSPGEPSVNIKGQGAKATVLEQSCSISNPTLWQPPSTINYSLATIDWEDFSINSNQLAPAVIGLYGSQVSIVKNMNLSNPALGGDHWMEIGSSGNAGWVYELDMENITLDAAGYADGRGAAFSTTVSGGVPTVTVTAGGEYYGDASGTGGDWPATPYLTGNAGATCNYPGTSTITTGTNGTITGFTTTASACPSNTVAGVFGGPNIPYGFKFTNMSDSHFISSLLCEGIGSSDCIYLSDVTAFNTFYKVHPISSFDGILIQNNNNFIATQVDSVLRRGFDFELDFGTANVYATQFEWNSSTLAGSGDYYFGTVGTPPGQGPYAINIFGDMCSVPSTFSANYWHMSANGINIDADGTMPPTVHAEGTQFCQSSLTSPLLASQYTGASYNWSPGTYSNVYQWAMTPGDAGEAFALTLTNPVISSGSSEGLFTFNINNPSAATSSFNSKSPIAELSATYWNGTASTSFGVAQQLTFGTGSNPAATYAFTHIGTLPGSLTYTFDNPVTLPTGSTATTQTTGDNTTKVATDAFVQSNGVVIPLLCGGSNDTTAITNALSSGNDGKTVYVTGSCVYHNASAGLSITWNGSIEGNGNTSSISCDTLANDCLTFNGTTGLVISGIAMSFGPTRTTRSYTTGRLLTINGGSNISLDHMTFNNGNVVGLEVQQATHISLHDLYVSNFLANGIFTVNNVDLKASDISTYNNGDAGFESSFYDGEASTSCNQIALSNFVSNNDEAGVYFNGCQHMSLTNFSILNPLNIGIAVVQDSSTTVTQVPDDVTISNGSVIGAGLGQAGAADAYGIYGNIATSSLTAPSRVNISNVVVRNSTGPGVQFGDYNTYVLQFDNLNIDTTGTGTASEGIYINGKEAHFSNVRVSKPGLRCLNIYAPTVFTSTNFTCENPNVTNTDTKAIWDQTPGNVTFNGINLNDTYATTGRSGITQASTSGNHTYNQINPSITGTWQGVTFAANTGGGNSTVYSTTLTPEDVTSSATPTFSLNTEVSTMLLTSNVTTFTLPDGFNGQRKVLNWCQEGSGSYTVTPPSNVRGFTTPTSTLFKCTTQPFTYFVLDAAWLATAGAGLNQ